MKIKVRDIAEGMEIAANIHGFPRQGYARVVRVEPGTRGVRVWLEGQSDFIGLSPNTKILQKV